ncbi:MAG: 4'-phosphopantetheinyl transferase superfamily protein [Gammaproteobacteria bacterium]
MTRGGGALHIYYADQRDLVGERMAQLTTQADREHSAAVTHPRRRAERLAGRALLRYALEQFTGRSATSHELRAAAEGKPECVGGPAISLSHSGEIVVCAVAAVDAVGVDVETRRARTFSAATLAAQYFTPEETAWVEGDADRFRMLWVLKEAYLKALGVGLAGGLRALECRIAPPSIDTRVAAGAVAPHVALYAAHGGSHLGVAWQGAACKVAITLWTPAAAADGVGPFELIAASA